MAKITFETKNRIVSSVDFPKLKLAKNERARVALLENPEYGWTHDLRAPKITDGRVEYQIVQRKDGTSFEAPKMEWVGRHRCKGDDDIIEGDGRGLDAKHCPMCAVAKESPNKVDAPKRRFAVHVVKYNTKPGTYDLSDAPFSVGIFVWQFTEFLYDKLIGINSIVGSLSNNDLLLGPCTDVQFQKFDLNYAMDAIWKSSPEYKDITTATLKSNRAPDLMSYVARDSELRWIEKDLETVSEAYRVMTGKGDEPKLAATEMPKLQGDLENLLNNTAPEAPAVTAKPEQKSSEPEGKVGFESLLDL
jgi:hypothetical protein